MIKVFFVVFLIIPNHDPIPYQEEKGSILECLAAVEDVLKRPPPKGGNLQAGCAVVDSPDTKT